MGFFESKKIFFTSQQIKDALYHIQSLDAAQRQVVFDVLAPKLDGGGVTAEEFKHVVIDLHQQHAISDIDEHNLLALIESNQP